MLSIIFVNVEESMQAGHVLVRASMLEVDLAAKEEEEEEEAMIWESGLTKGWILAADRPDASREPSRWKSSSGSVSASSMFSASPPS